MVEVHKGNSWIKAANGLEKTARGHLYGIRAMQTLGLVAMLAVVVGYWVILDIQYASVLLAFLGVIAVLLRAVALRRWKLSLAQPWVVERVSNILVLGPDFIKEIYQYTPRPFWFMLGLPQNNLLGAAGFVSQHLRWFLRRNPEEYKPVYGIALVFSLLVVIALTSVLLEFAGYKHSFQNFPGIVFPTLSISLLFGLGFYFVYLLERQVIALNRVAGIIRELASPD